MIPSMPARALLALALVLPSLTLAQATQPDAPRQAPPQGAAQPSAASPERLRTLLAEADDLYTRRDDPAALAAHRARLEEAEKLAPNDYEVLWRLSRIYFWLADDPKLDGKEKSRLGKISWDYGDRATAASPNRVEGWHFAAGGLGNYALGIGILTALRQGIEGKFKERLSRAEAIDPNFQNGAIQTAWGRFWFELPWPKYSPEKAVKSLEAALKKNPQNVRAHVYLADVHEKEGRPEAAAAELRKALADVPGRYDAPEERRWQEGAKHTLTGR
jgi:tetratricopeptide (TPR) repeat protein